jgi:hypothetical protein
MKAFLVRVNGKRICKAGVGPNGVLTTIVHWVGDGKRRSAEGYFGFSVGGIDGRTEEHVDYDTPNLTVGDKISIEIMESDQVDPETKRYVFDASGGGRTPRAKAAGAHRRASKSARSRGRWKTK